MSLASDVILWSDKQKFDLPWRDDRTLYKTLVSEIMLQQTTVSTVINHFNRFINKYPDLVSLAQATDEEMTIQWKGLGYYRRARNLLAAARFFVDEHGGQIPLEYELLIEAPGIGVYTANAILAIGANKKALCIDANLERVLARIFLIEEEKGPKLQKMIATMFESRQISFGNNISYRQLNESLMDLGRIYCQARKASCLVCPVSKHCKSYKQGNPLEIPIVKQKKKTFYELTLARFICWDNNKVAVYKKGTNQWLSGQNELPTLIMKSQDQDLSQYKRLAKEMEIEPIGTIKTTITSYKIKNDIFEVSGQKLTSLFKQEIFFVDPQSEQSNLSTASMKCLKSIKPRKK